MDFDSLNCFVAAAANLNFRKAAKQVALSPAAFSVRIQQLEDTLGVVLFERSTRRMQLSPAGERLLPHAKECLALAGRCVEVVNEPSGPLSYQITIGTRYELGMSWVVPSLAQLERSHPERRIHLAFGDTNELLQSIEQQQVDCAITSARLSDARFQLVPLHEEDYVFVASPKLIKKHPLKNPSHCATHRLLDLDSSLPLFRYFLDARPPQEDWAFGHVQHLGTIGPVKELVKQGVGVGVLPRYFVQEELAAKRLVKLMPRTSMAKDWFRLVWRKGDIREPRIRELAQELKTLKIT